MGSKVKITLNTELHKIGQKFPHSYFSSDILGMSHLDLLVQELAAVCEKWQYIGEEIGVGYSISDIRTTYSKPEDCLREVLHE